MSDLLNWLLEEKNKGTCRAVGIFLLAVPLLFFFARFSFSGGSQGLLPGWFIFSTRWFRDIFIVVMAVMAFFRIIFIIGGSCRRKEGDE